MKYISFTEEQKAKLFDEIAKHYYESNFGQASKADMELLMFRFYIEKMINENKADDGTVDYCKISDYKISKDLGITQQKVRNLKLKNHLCEPIDFDWKLSFATLIKNARYEKQTQTVKINIPDPVLFMEVQNYVEEKGGYIDKQFNGNILQLRAEYFLDLAISLEPEKSQKEVKQILKKQFEDAENKNGIFDSNDITVQKLVDVGVGITEIIVNIKEILNPNSIILKSVLKFLEEKL